MRKKLFAVIMSVMMMVTFMPTMAFATQVPNKSSLTSGHGTYYVDNVRISTDYSSATGDIYSSTTGNLVKANVQAAKYNWNDKESQFIASDGTTMVGFRFNNTDYRNDNLTTTAADGSTVHDVATDPLFIKVYYYDLTNAKLVIKKNVNSVDTYVAIEKADTVQYGKLVDLLDNNTKWTINNEWNTQNKDAYKWFNQLVAALETTSSDLYVQFSDNDGNKFNVGLTSLLDKNATLTVYPLEGYEDFADGKYTLKYDFDSENAEIPNGYGTGTSWDDEAMPAKNGSQEQTVELKTNTAPTLADMKFNSGKQVAINVENHTTEGLSLGYTRNKEIYYTGEDQKLTLVTKGFVAQYYYKAEGETARAWHDEAPAMVNADEYKIQVRFSPEGKTDWTAPELLKVKISAQPAQMLFKYDTYTVRGTKIDAKKVLTLKEGGDVVLADADKTVFDTIVDKYVTFSQEDEYAFDEYEVTAKLDCAGLFTDKDATIAQFLKNYSLYKLVYDSVNQLYIGSNLDKTSKYKTSVTVTNNYNIIDNVTAVNQTKTFHIKKAAKLKKNKTFVLKGDKVEYGTITYIKKSGNGKIKVASNGKVTVKKGLKKGTYTVKIKVKATGDSEIKTLKVRIVK